MQSRTSLPSICIALGFQDAAELLEHARREVDSGESFLEFRLDYLTAPETGLAAIRALLDEHPECTVLATCRRHQNRGHFNGSIDEQIKLLSAAIDAGARAVDVEIESADNIAAHLENLRGRARLIVSYHNYESTPALEALLRRMQKIPADAYKIVTTARKPSDNLRVLGLAKTHARVPMIVLAMGEAGLSTRVLSPSFGGIYTYAAPNAAEGTASGQINARNLRHLYRLERFTKAAKVFGVIADPVRHSISPHVHNRAFQARRMDAVYLPFLVQPAQLRDFLDLAEGLPVAGFSVTIPHKQKILRYLDVVDPLSRRIGAVNTVWRKAGKWRATNTDAKAVTEPLSKHLRLSKSTVLVAGNGGAARSAAIALTEAGATLAITGRNPDRVRALAKICGAEALPPAEAAGRKFDALVHSTPLGMFPHAEECFFDGPIPAGIVFDMVYNPMETLLIRRAAEQGCTVVRGIEMFMEQAVQQFEIFTGESAPRAAMEKAALEALS